MNYHDSHHLVEGLYSFLYLLTTRVCVCVFYSPISGLCCVYWGPVDTADMNGNSCIVCVL